MLILISLLQSGIDFLLQMLKLRCVCTLEVIWNRPINNMDYFKDIVDEGFVFDDPIRIQVLLIYVADP